MYHSKIQLHLFKVIMHRDEWDDEDEEPKWAGAPLTTKEKDMLRYYYYIHNGIDTRYIYRIFTHNTNLSNILPPLISS